MRMRRREFIALGGAAVVSLPVAAQAQQQKMPVVGFLRSATLTDATAFVTGFRQGLKEEGYVEGQNVAIEFRAADNHPDRLPALLAELIGIPVSVIAANSVAAIAAKSATATIPIVFASGDDPVRDGLVASLNRPGGNVTGVSFISGELGAKRLQLLGQIAPKGSTIATLVNPGTLETDDDRRDVQAAAQKFGQPLIVLEVVNDRDIETAFNTIVQRGAGAVLVGPGAFLTSKRQLLIDLAARYRLPASYSLRDSAVAGGLMSYGADLADAYRQAGNYVGRILKGAKPADLPVQQPTKFELVINLKTAKALGLTVPPTLLALADEVIE
jgi:putative tryptophan/tyrosine transport system substrate-binding protein